jgi:hypothetical protein
LFKTFKQFNRCAPFMGIGPFQSFQLFHRFAHRSLFKSFKMFNRYAPFKSFNTIKIRTETSTFRGVSKRRNGARIEELAHCNEPRVIAGLKRSPLAA